MTATNNLVRLENGIQSLVPLSGSGALAYYNANSIEINEHDSTNYFPDQPLTPFANHGSLAFDPLVGMEIEAIGWFPASDAAHSAQLAVSIFDALGVNLATLSPSLSGTLSTSASIAFYLKTSIIPIRIEAPGVYSHTVTHEARIGGSSIVVDTIGATVTSAYTDGPFRVAVGVSVGGNRNHAVLARLTALNLS